MRTTHANYTPQFEHVPVSIFANSQSASKGVAAEIATLIRKRQTEGRKAVLGLATGSTPVAVYAELVRLHKQEGLSFQNVVTFNLDEYLGLQKSHKQSYHFFMHYHLFSHIDIRPENVNIPRGDLTAEEIEGFCAGYEEKIRENGGIDIQVLGIGRTGHIGFNEPGSPRHSLTRLVHLDPLTRRDASGDFGGEALTPHKAITMGVRSILNARRLILMAWGQHKAEIVRQAVEGDVSAQVTASFLQEHGNAVFVLDAAAASALTRTRAPWLLGPLADQGLSWTPSLTRRAILWLAGHKQKAILKLTDEDYNESGLQDLIQTFGSAYEANLFGFYAMQHTITGWPGGRDPERTREGDAPVRPLKAKSAKLYPKRILVLSPHPDDDVLSMGGTLCRLVEHGHQVHVAYEVTGAGAVPQEELWSVLDFAESSGLVDSAKLARVREWNQALQRGESPANNTEEKEWKALIREHEARASARVCGVPAQNLHFLKLPFYESGEPRRRRLGSEDAARLLELLNTLQPHMIFAAGDLDDPHGTHRLCLHALRDALKLAAGQAWLSETELWLYRGAWNDYPLDEIDMAVPLSPQELSRRRRAVSCHRTQKDQTMLVDNRLCGIWQSTEERSRLLAEGYNRLGLAEYEAMEAFRRYSPEEFLGSTGL